jgi:hypothetical protein
MWTKYGMFAFSENKSHMTIKKTDLSLCHLHVMEEEDESNQGTL